MHEMTILDDIWTKYLIINFSGNIHPIIMKISEYIQLELLYQTILKLDENLLFKEFSKFHTLKEGSKTTYNL
jgi:hypothetical protein